MVALRCSSTLQSFQFVESARPVSAEQAREAAVGQDLAAGLAAGAVVGFVVGIADALHLLPAARTGLIEAAVHGHLGPKCGDLFGEFLLGFGVQAIDPEGKCGAGGGEEALPLVGLSLCVRVMGESWAACRISSE